MDKRLDDIESRLGVVTEKQNALIQDVKQQRKKLNAFTDTLDYYQTNFKDFKTQTELRLSLLTTSTAEIEKRVGVLADMIKQSQHSYKVYGIFAFILIIIILLRLI